MSVHLQHVGQGPDTRDVKAILSTWYASPYELTDNGYQVELGCVHTKVDMIPLLGSLWFGPCFCR